MLSTGCMNSHKKQKINKSGFGKDDFNPGSSYKQPKFSPQESNFKYVFIFVLPKWLTSVFPNNPFGS